MPTPFPTEISRARREDAPRLKQIAFAAKRHWGYPERWMQSWRELLTITPEFIASQETYVATVNGEKAGFYGLLNAGEKVRMEHLWILPAAMGQGVGRALFVHAVERARTLGFRCMEIESDPNAEGFYRRMGARRRASVITELEGIRRELPLLIYEVRGESTGRGAAPSAH